MLKRSVWEHMTYGGYPKVVTTSENEMKRIILLDLYETMLFKDISRTFSIQDLAALERFVRYLAAGVGALLSYQKVSNELNISFQTIKKYLDAMEKSYLVVPVRPFFTNKKKELIKQPRYYFLDTGLRNAIARSFDTEPDGALFENYVLSELVKMGLSPRYWRTKAKAELDFIVERKGGIIPVEVKLKALPGKIERSLRSFISTYEPEMAVVVSYRGETGTTRVGGCEVVFVDIPGLWKTLGPESVTYKKG